MATKNPTAAAAPDLKIHELPGEAGERRGVALEAFWEVSSIADWLAEWWATNLGTTESMYVRGAIARLQQLSSIGMSALDDDDKVSALQKRLTGVQQQQEA